MEVAKFLFLIGCIIIGFGACEDDDPEPIHASSFGTFDTVYIDEPLVSGYIVDDTTDVTHSFYMYGPVDESHYYAMYTAMNVDLDSLLLRDDIRLMNDYCEVTHYPYGRRIFSWTPTPALVEPGKTYVWIMSVDFGDKKYEDGNIVFPFHVLPERGQAELERYDE